MCIRDRRYTLQENECRSVTLREEMDFVNAYIFLLKMRYEDNLVFDIDLGKEHESKQLPPMSVQQMCIRDRYTGYRGDQ